MYIYYIQWVLQYVDSVDWVTVVQPIKDAAPAIPWGMQASLK